ncbi:MAG: hypothetical protein OSB69_07240 [Alphaproteobacteria bacterium]|nr:hypothetical protein [Alphaproteobacteria bacterium]
MFSALGIVCLVGAITWTYTVNLRRFPPDVADPTALAWALPDIPSVVVLPVAAVTLTDKDTLLAGRFGNELLEMLAGIPGLFAISPETSARLAGGQFRIKSTAEALGVRYLVTGTLSRVGKKYRVFLRVIDAFSGEAEWSEDYDTDPAYLFQVPGLALANILDAMDVDLEDHQVAKFAARGPSKPQGWTTFAEAVAYRVTGDRESMSNSLTRLLKVQDDDPDWSAPPREIAWTYLNAARRGWGGFDGATVSGLMSKGVGFADMLIKQHPESPFGPARKAALLTVIQGDTEETVALWREAARLGPNIFPIQWALSQVLIRAGRHQEALVVMKHALRVHPLHPVSLTQKLAELEFAAGRTEDAFKSLDAVLEKRPAAQDPRLMRVFVLGTLDRRADAAADVEEFLILHPNFSFSRWSARQGRRGRPERLDWKAILSAAGIPD